MKGQAKNMLNKFKKFWSSHFKKILIIAVPTVFVVVMCVIISVMVAKKNASKEVVQTTEPPVVDVYVPVTIDPNEKIPVLSGVASEGLIFRSLGNGRAAVTGIGTCTDTYIVIPVVSDGNEIVCEIAENAFLGCKNISGVEIHSRIEKIGEYAFYTSSLKSVVLHSKINEIGSFAFAGCQSLLGISVEAANTKYCDIDGALYSKDKTTLICYPSGKSSTVCFIDKAVTSISKMAFYDCCDLETIRYNGTRAEWTAIIKGDGNSSLSSATVEYYVSTPGNK